MTDFIPFPSAPTHIKDIKYTQQQQNFIGIIFPEISPK